MEDNPSLSGFALQRLLYSPRVQFGQQSFQAKVAPHISHALVWSHAGQFNLHRMLLIQCKTLALAALP